MKYAYYPGCSSESTARDMHKSTLAVARALNLEFEEPKGWTCCGATAGHQTDRMLAVNLSATNLAKVKDMNLDMVVNCAACYNRMKTANHEITSREAVRKNVREALDRDYDGSVKVRHLLEVLLEDIGLPDITRSLKRTLNRIKVACYYGCLLVRPPEIVKFDVAENPKSLDRLITALGGESLEWPGKVDCCGGSLSLSRTDVVLQLTGSILDSAMQAGAECIAVSCPMCQINLDVRQQDLNRQSGGRYHVPVLYITQLLGLCLGLGPKDLGLEKLMIPAAEVLKRMEVQP
jgi:heterodisulfide reductase subunit B2